MVINSVTYTSTIENMIISNLDGWIIEQENTTTTTIDQETNTQNDTGINPFMTTQELENTTTTTTTTDQETNTQNDTGINPFMTTQELENKANKVITSSECQLFYEETLDLAYMHTNRLNIEDLTSVEARIFIRGVCKWTASNLWNKYNIRVNNENMEDTYVQSYGGLLYSSALKTLQPFVNQRITTISSITQDKNNADNDNIWIV